MLEGFFLSWGLVTGWYVEEKQCRDFVVGGSWKRWGGRMRTSVKCGRWGDMAIRRVVNLSSLYHFNVFCDLI